MQMRVPNCASEAFKSLLLNYSQNAQQVAEIFRPSLHEVMHLVLNRYTVHNTCFTTLNGHLVEKQIAQILIIAALIIY